MLLDLPPLALERVACHLGSHDLVNLFDAAPSMPVDRAALILAAQAAEELAASARHVGDVLDALPVLVCGVPAGEHLFEMRPFATLASGVAVEDAAHVCMPIGVRRCAKKVVAARGRPLVAWLASTSLRGGALTIVVQARRCTAEMANAALATHAGSYTAFANGTYPLVRLELQQPAPGARELRRGPLVVDADSRYAEHLRDALDRALAERCTTNATNAGGEPISMPIPPFRVPEWITQV